MKYHPKDVYKPRRVSRLILYTHKTHKPLYQYVHKFALLHQSASDLNRPCNLSILQNFIDAHSKGLCLICKRTVTYLPACIINEWTSLLVIFRLQGLQQLSSKLCWCTWWKVHLHSDTCMHMLGKHLGIKGAGFPSSRWLMLVPACHHAPHRGLLNLLYPRASSPVRYNDRCGLKLTFPERHVGKTYLQRHFVKVQVGLQ